LNLEMQDEGAVFMRLFAIILSLVTSMTSVQALAQNSNEIQVTAADVCTAIRAEEGDGLFRCDDLGPETTEICRGLRAVRTRTRLDTCENLHGIAKAFCDGVNARTFGGRLNPCEYLNGMALEVCRGHGASSIKTLLDPCEYTHGLSMEVCHGFLAARSKSGSCPEK
jgi:hypothetical protein